LEVAGHRAAVVALEDEMTSEKERLRNVEKENIVLMQKLADAMQKHEHLLEESKSQSKEIVLMKQSLEISQNATDNNTVEDLQGADGQGSGRASDHVATNSQIRMLNNKVEYLKAQISSEATTKDEYETTIKSLRAEKDVLLSSNREKLRETEEKKDKEIVQLQEQIQMYLGRPNEEVAQLNSKVAQLQLQLDTALQDVCQARKKEDFARGDAIKEQSQLRIAKANFASAKSELEEARKEIEVLMEANKNATVNEAMLRRLDNERRYLKNQLQSEITCKNELLDQLEAVEKCLSEEKATSKIEADSLNSKQQKDNQAHDSLVSQLRGSNQVLEAEVKVQKGQLTEMTEAYTKIRDQLRLEQTSAEQMRAASQRMARELKAAQDELSLCSKVAEEAAVRHNETTKAISGSIKKADDMRIDEIRKLQLETKQALKEASDTQRDMMTLRQRSLEQIKHASKVRASHILVSLVSKGIMQRKLRAFLIWNGHITASKTKDIIEDQAKERINDAEQWAQQECDKAVLSVTKRVESEKEATVKKLQDQMSEERKTLLKMSRESQQKCIETERARLNEIMREKQSLWNSKEKEIHELHQAAMARVARENNRNIQNVQERAQKKLEDSLSEADSTLKERQAIIIKDCDRRWEAKIKEVELTCSRKIDDALVAAQKEKEDELSKERERLAKEHEDYMSKMDDKIQVAVKNETSRMEGKISCAVADCDSSWISRLEDVDKNHANELFETENRLKVQFNAKEDEMRSKQTNAIAEIEKKHANAIHQALKIEKEQTLKAVKVERSKWQTVSLNTVSDLLISYKFYIHLYFGVFLGFMTFISV